MPVGGLVVAAGESLVAAIVAAVVVAVVVHRSGLRVAGWQPRSLADATEGRRATIRGTVEPVSGRRTDPVTRSDCLAYRTTLDSRYDEAWHESHDKVREEDFAETYEDATAFAIDDGTGTVRVEPDELTLYGRERDVTEGNEAAARRFVRDRGGPFGETPDMFEDQVEVSLATIRVESGDTVTATGRLESNGDETVLVPADGVVGLGGVLATDRDEYAIDLRRSMLRTAAAATPVLFVVFLILQVAT